MDKVNLREKLALFDDHWSPKIVGELNGQHVKLVKFQGEFVWHKHDHEDELFLVVKGRFRMEFRDRHVWLEEGEFLIVPRGVEHRPVAEEEAHVLLFEPAATLNTGDVRDERTVDVDPSGSDPCPRSRPITVLRRLADLDRRDRSDVSSGLRPPVQAQSAAARLRGRGVRGAARGLAARGLPALHHRDRQRRGRSLLRRPALRQGRRRPGLGGRRAGRRPLEAVPAHDRLEPARIVLGRRARPAARHAARRKKTG